MARFISRLAFAFAAVLIATVAFGIAVSYLFYALFLLFATKMAPWLAGLATAGVLIVFALIVLLIGRGMASTAMPKKPAASKEPHPFTHILGSELGGLAAKNPIVAVAAALVAGVALGVSPALRHGIFDLFRRR
jgi:hypothetical protein